MHLTSLFFSYVDHWPVLGHQCSTDRPWPNPIEYSTPTSQILLHAAEKPPLPLVVWASASGAPSVIACVSHKQKTVLLTLEQHLVSSDPKSTTSNAQTCSLEEKLYRRLVLSYIGNMNRPQCPHSPLTFPDSAGKSGDLLKFTL